VYNVDVAKIEIKVFDHVRREQFYLDPNVIISLLAIGHYII